MTNKPAVVLFACVENAGRSQMAKALFNMCIHPAAATAISAGSKPAEHVLDEVVEVMQELGIDLTSAKPQKLTAELAATATVLVTMGCQEDCPYVPGVKVIAWQIPDPHGQKVVAVRELRDLLKQKVLELAEEEGYPMSANTALPQL